MKLLNYDFYDLSALFVYLRNNPQNLDFKPAVKELVDYFSNYKNTTGADENTVRQILRKYVKSDIETLSWVFVDNKYTYIQIIKNDACYNLIFSVLTEMLKYFDDLERMQLLCDSVHNIPILISNEKITPKTIIDAIIDYRRKYNKEFLANELSNLTIDMNL